MSKTSSVKTRRTSSANKSKPREQYVCGVCGLTVAVDPGCGCTDAGGLICCNKVMKPAN